MKATDIKMYVTSLEIVKKSKTTQCGDWLGGRITANHISREEALDSIKDAVYIFLFAYIMKKFKDYKNIQFAILACNSTIYDKNLVQEEVCKITYKDMIQIIKNGYRSPMFDTLRDKKIIDTRLKELKIA